MKILLVEPPFERFIGQRCEWYPIGLTSIATVLNAKGHSACVYNAEHDNRLPYLDIESYVANFHRYSRALKEEKGSVWQELRDVLIDYKPDVIGLTIKTVKMFSALRVAKMAKEIYPKVKIVAGGPHPTVCPDEVLASHFIDYVVQGEGEETMVELVEILSNGTDLRGVTGVSYKKEGAFYHNNPRPLISNLETLPYPDRKLLVDYESYTSNQLGWLMASRGCPYDCAYCSSKTVWSRKVRYRPLENVLEEVEKLRREHGVTNLNFMDDSLTVNRQYVFNLCKAFLEKKLRITWSCLTRPDLLDEEIIKKMKVAGCTKVDIGVESGSQRIRKIINKGIDLDQVRKMAIILRRNNIFWAGFFMMGFPGETRDDVLATLKFMKEIKPNWVYFSIFTPYPGTALYERAKELGIIPKEMDFSLYAHQSPDNCFSEKMSTDEFRELTRIMLKEFNCYNASFHALFRRVLTKNYFRNPKLFFHDLRKWLTWILPLNSKRIISGKT